MRTLHAVWDPQAVYRRAWARATARIGDMPRARQLWKDVMADGYARQHDYWLECVELERRYEKDMHVVRKAYYRVCVVAFNYYQTCCRLSIQRLTFPIACTRR
jgi:hypothetical protein